MTIEVRPRVVLSGFADEASESKDLREQLAVCAALGLRFFSIRFVNLGDGIKHVMALDAAEIAQVQGLIQDYGMRVCCLGSPIGKIKLRDEVDGTSNRYVPIQKYLETEVQHACNLAHGLDTRLLRGFSFYPPKGQPVEPYLPQAVDNLGKIADRCQAEGLIFGLEVEANLTGRSGASMAALYHALRHPAVMLIFDGANLTAQGYSRDQVVQAYFEMKPGLGWLHVKDYRLDPNTLVDQHVDEGALQAFVPVGMGDSGYPEILADLKTSWSPIEQRLQAVGADGIFLDLEPHLRGGGQFGGYSGPDGFGIALRALCDLLTKTGFDYSLRDPGVFGL